MELSNKVLQKKLTIFLCIALVIFAILVARLFQLQVVNAHEFRDQASEIRNRVIYTEARRGDIISADGHVLATSVPVFRISMSHLPQRERAVVIENLVEILDDPEITEEVINEKVSGHTMRFKPLPIVTLQWDEQGMETITRLEERRADLPGVIVEEVPQRYYPFGSLAGHTVGYVGQINQRELELSRNQLPQDIFPRHAYLINDMIGKVGIERAAELRFSDDGSPIGLRGGNGMRHVEVNVAGRPVRELHNLPPTPGNNVHLTIDVSLQKVLEEAMIEAVERARQRYPHANAGAAVVMNVNTGAILSIVSLPYMNPNDFVDGSFSERRYYYEDPDLRPQFNRAISATYPPGSTFKMITQIAALESGNVNLSHTVVCHGAYWRPPNIPCIGIHGRLGFHRALAVSCNTHAQDIAWLAGIDSIVDVGQQFGLGMRSASQDLPGEAAGLMPSPEWKRNISSILVTRSYENRRDEIEKRFQTLRGEATTFDEIRALDEQRNRELVNLEAWFRDRYRFETRWHPFDTFNTSIGQGSVDLTVLQLASFTATLANGGTRYVPYLIDRIESPQGEIVMQYEPVIAHVLDISPESLAEVVRGMYYTSHRSFGTANRWFRDFPSHITVASKTGTAETGRARDGFHGVFVAFAPVDDPQIAIAVLIEYGRTGGGSGGPVARAVFQEYFGLNH